MYNICYDCSINRLSARRRDVSRIRGVVKVGEVTLVWPSAGRHPQLGKN